MKVQARLPRVLFLRVNCSKQPFLHRQVVRDLSPSSRESSLTRLTWAICKRRTRCKGAMLAAATPLRETIAYSLKQIRAMIAALTGCPWHIRNRSCRGAGTCLSTGRRKSCGVSLVYVTAPVLSKSTKGAPSWAVPAGANSSAESLIWLALFIWSGPSWCPG
jgi:hypothetical protein